MVVELDKKRFVISDTELPYDPYYFAITARHTKTGWDSVVKDVLRQWAEELLWQAAGETLYLPFGIYDQCLQCLMADLSKGQVALRCVWLNIEGFKLDLSDLGAFMSRNHEVYEASPEILGTFRRTELIAGLKEAKLRPGESNL